ncbi:hypothetical protein K505DRAFT_261948, partial [Melanomma pulvis-pyrius CBS 109.77]
GYVRSNATCAISLKHAEHKWTCLVRNAEKRRQISALLPDVTLVFGNFDSPALIAEEAAKADIVLNQARYNNERAVKAIFRGFSTRSPTGFYILISGTGILKGEDRRVRSFSIEQTRFTMIPMASMI